MVAGEMIGTSGDGRPLRFRLVAWWCGSTVVDQPDVIRVLPGFVDKTAVFGQCPACARMVGSAARKVAAFFCALDDLPSHAGVDAILVQQRVGVGAGRGLGVGGHGVSSVGAGRAVCLCLRLNLCWGVARLSVAAFCAVVGSPCVSRRFCCGCRFRGRGVCVSTILIGRPGGRL